MLNRFVYKVSSSKNKAAFLLVVSRFYNWMYKKAKILWSKLWILTDVDLQKRSVLKH